MFRNESMIVGCGILSSAARATICNRSNRVRQHFGPFQMNDFACTYMLKKEIFARDDISAYADIFVLFCLV